MQGNTVNAQCEEIIKLLSFQKKKRIKKHKSRPQSVSHIQSSPAGQKQGVSSVTLYQVLVGNLAALPLLTRMTTVDQA